MFNLMIYLSHARARTHSSSKNEKLPFISVQIRRMVYKESEVISAGLTRAMDTCLNVLRYCIGSKPTDFRGAKNILISIA